VSGATYTIFAFWDDLMTSEAGHGVFTTVQGSAPNRVLYIEWRASYFPGTGYVNFELRFEEGSSGDFEIIYGAGGGTPVGVQRDTSNFSWIYCAGGGPNPGVRLIFTGEPCLTVTPTVQVSVTSTPTPGVCPPGGRYRITEATGTVMPGVTDTGNHCDDCLISFVLPFPVRLYENTYTQAQIGSNGVLVFGTPPGQYTDVPCVPPPDSTYVVLPFWNNLRTDTAGSGVYTLVTGSAPNRELYIEWRATLFGGGQEVNFHVHFTEGMGGGFDIVYGNVPAIIQGVGVQRDQFNSSWYSCTGGSPDPGLRLIFTGEPCLTVTPGATQIVSTFTPTAQATNTPTSSSINTGTSTATTTATPSAVCGGLAWRIAPTPSGGNQTLRGIEVISPTDIWEVGSNGAKHWDGVGWQDMNSPLTDLYDVGATSANNVWAVGTSGIVRWNGTSWSWSRTEWYENFTDVEVVSANDIWAVGYAYVGLAQPWIAHWDGQSWSLVDRDPSPLPINYLYGVSVQGTDVWMVGWKGNAQSVSAWLLRWNGSQWDEWTHAGGGQAKLYDVEALAPDNVWAVGEDGGQTLVLHWDGTTWNEVSTPVFGAVNGVEALSPSDIWAVGDEGVMHWDGAGWSLVDAPPMNLEGIDAFAPDDIWAVGAGAIHYSTALFADVPPGYPFYPFIQCLACRNVLGGYADGTFRPQNNMTRGQLAKVVSNAAGFDEDPGPQIYEDVPTVNTFYAPINRLSNRGHMSGYPCGGTGEPCGPENRPYFRPGANVTRGQAAKIVSNAAGFIEPVSGQSYQDVPPSHTFYEFIERLTARNIMSGYACPGGGINPCTGQYESCWPPEQRPFFRPCVNITRGQASKIVANTFFPECPTR
jgi:hypothetical protein